MVIIIVISSIPNLATPKFETSLDHLFSIRLDYIAHFILFYFLTTFFLLSRLNLQNSVKPHIIIIFCVCAMASASLLEYYQTFIPGRAFNANDLLYNCLGTIFGAIITYFVIIKLWFRKRVLIKEP